MNPESSTQSADSAHRNGLEIAIVGVSLRFPGAENVETFWKNLTQGIESISFFTEEELIAEDNDPDTVRHPNYVKAKGLLPGVQYFDHQLFGYSQKDAMYLDPQLRVFHEAVYAALETAGYGNESYQGRIGLFGGATNNIFWEMLTLSLLEGGGFTDQFAMTKLNDKDFLCNRVAYKLNLRGPAVSVQSACSTSLLAVDLACRSLLTGECDAAIAGGISLTMPNKHGYLYEEGMIYSPDGHCRAFDEMARGTVEGNGVGLVVLKRLDDAINDGDFIWGVIKGSASNNDGNQKAGFTAPGINGQVEVIKTALYMADIAPETIGYVETHGTGTELGDPIEIEALKQALDLEPPMICGLGSVKSNIGHLDTAAGVASLIKATLCVQRGWIPPSLHIDSVSPRLDLKGSGLHVVRELTKWDSPDHPRRAGVSSFGIGGTNVHVIVEEPPPQIVPTASSYPCLITLSAKSQTALQHQCTRLSEHLQQHPETNLSDVGYTLGVGRRQLTVRHSFVCDDVTEAIESLGAKQTKTPRHSSDGRIVLMFPAQGSQYVGMGQELYESMHSFRTRLDYCFSQLHKLTGEDYNSVLYPSSQSLGVTKLDQTEYTQPLLFCVEYALAQNVMEWTGRPAALIGHSLGEYVAACLSGVFDLDAALELIVKRAQLMQRLESGAMLSVGLSESDLEPLLNADLSIALHNSSNQYVVAGTKDSIAQLENKLKRRGCSSVRLRTSHAFHSPMMTPILDDFTAEVEKLTLHPPTIPFISNLSGSFIREEEACSPSYWRDQLSNKARFAEGIGTLLADEKAIFVEVGPGRSLTSLVRSHKACSSDRCVVNLMPRAEAANSSMRHLLTGLGRLWEGGGSVDWEQFYHRQQRRRIPLPTYPFAKNLFWLKGNPFIVGQTTQQASAAEARVTLEPQNKETHSVDKENQVDNVFEIDVADGENKKLLLELWRDLLGENEVHLDSNFFEAGGDSLKAMQLASKLTRAGMDVTPNDILAHQTIRKLADFLDNSQSTSKLNQPIIVSEVCTQLGDKLKIDIQPCRFEIDGESWLAFFVPDEFAIGNRATDIATLIADQVPSEAQPDYLLPLSRMPQNAKSKGICSLTRDAFDEMLAHQPPPPNLIRDLRIRLRKNRLQRSKSARTAGVVKKFPFNPNQRIPLPNVVTSIHFDEVVDLNALTQAYRDLVARHGMLRSMSHGAFAKHWVEYGIFEQLDIPCFDLSDYPTEEAAKLAEKVTMLLARAKVSSRRSLMYDAVLVKKSLRNWTLYFAFSHLISDGTTGQIAQRSIRSQYQAQRAGKTNPKRLPIAKADYSDYVTMLAHGPNELSEEALIERFDLARFDEHKRAVERRIQATNSRVIRTLVYEIDHGGQTEEQQIWERVFVLFNMAMSKHLQTDVVPLKLIHFGRNYAAGSFSDVMGEFIDILPLPICVHKKSHGSLIEQLNEKVRFASDNNINFSSLLLEKKLRQRYPRAAKMILPHALSTRDPMVILNFLGKLSRRETHDLATFARRIDGRHRIFRFASFGCHVAYTNKRILFLMFATFDNQDMEKLRRTFDEELERLRAAQKVTAASKTPTSKDREALSPDGSIGYTKPEQRSVSKRNSLRILILGGTRFLGRHITESALERGHHVTVFNRGRYNPKLYESTAVESLLGDRECDLEALKGHLFDVVFDTSAYKPNIAQKSAHFLKNSIGFYVFVSSTAVYTDPTAPNLEESTQVSKLINEAGYDMNAYSYGPMKALCEQVIEQELPNRVLHVRAGVMAGPYDYSDRLTYWVHRLSQKGEVLLPDCRKRKIQLIDGRDLAGWLLDMASRAKSGTYNVTGPKEPLTFERLINCCANEVATSARLHWVAENELLSLDVRPWVDLPLWIPQTHDEIDITRALSEGLTFRPLAHTVRDTLDWLQSRDEPFSYINGLRPDRERQILQQVRS